MRVLRQHRKEQVALEMLGHSTVSFTMDTYQHVRSAIQQTAAHAVDDSLGKSL